VAAQCDAELDNTHVFCRARDTKHASEPVSDVTNALHDTLAPPRSSISRGMTSGTISPPGWLWPA
jgi:hypothetical protein